MKKLTESEFNEALRKRITAIRKGMRWSQVKTAAFLDISLERYQKYETRSVMPPALIAKFASLFDMQVAYVLTGKDESPTYGITVERNVIEKAA